MSQPMRERRYAWMMWPLGLACLLGLLIWRAAMGVDLFDDGHAVELALRLRSGAVPFEDEMNLQVLGALPAVPFTYLWTELFGTSGLVLASRLFYLLLASIGATVAIRALRSGGVSRWVAFVAVCTPLLAPAYNLIVTSYNTVPQLALVVGVAAAFAAVRTASRRWAAAATACLAVGTACYPPMIISAVIIVGSVLWLTRRTELRKTVVLVAALAAVGPLIWLVRNGIDGIQRTLHFTQTFLSDRLAPGARVEMSASLYAQHLFDPGYWPMWALSLASLLTLASRPRTILIGRAAAAVIPVAAVIPSILSWPAREDTAMTFAQVAAVYGIVTGLAMVVPVWAHLRRSSSSVVRTLLGLAVPAGLVQAIVTVQTTSSGPAWGVPFTALSPTFMALVVGWQALLHGPSEGAVGCTSPQGTTSLDTSRLDRGAVVGHGRWLTGSAGITLVALMAGLLFAKPFRDPPPWNLSSRVTEGPYAGISTTPDNARMLGEYARTLSEAVGTRSSILIYGQAGGYLLTDAKPVTNVIWLDNNGAANAETIRYFARTGQSPDVAVVFRDSVSRAGGLAQLRQEDLFVDWLMRTYAGPSEQGSYLVFTKRAQAR